MKRLLLLATACLAIGAKRRIPITRPTPPLEVVVPGTLLANAEHIDGARAIRKLADGRTLFELEANAEQTIALRDRLLADGVDVELDLYRRGQAAPNDDGYPKQWALTLIKAHDAWKITTGDPALTVAVVDTGYVDHPDFVGRIAGGYDFISDPVSAGDGDGRDTDARDAGNESETSSGFHGPHISGIIGAATNNGIGMAGVDWNCRIQPVRVLGVRNRRGRDSDIADGIRWAAGLNVPGVPQNKTPARVINMSFGGPGFSRALQDAVNAATARGVLVIGSAGNSSEDAATNVPGALENVMSVAATGPDGALASYSNFGPRVDLMAPGGALLIDAPIGTDTPGAIWSTSFIRESAQPVFAYAAGTSQAAAYASGVAALVRAAAPSLGPEVVAAIMRRASALPKGGCPQECGSGLIDASRAVAYAKAVEAAACPSGCKGTNDVPPVPLRPEEGCSVSAVGHGGSASGSYAWLMVVGIALAIGRFRTAAMLLALIIGCASQTPGRESTTQSNAPLLVKIIDPIPTFESDELSIAIGTGREVEATVTPSSALDRVELVIAEDSTVIGRVAHAPFRFAVPGWVLGEGGRRLLCITARDASGRTGEACFNATR